MHHLGQHLAIPPYLNLNDLSSVLHGVAGCRYEKGKILIFVDKQEKCDSLFR